MPELSLQSTFWSYPPARDPYSSANLHSLHLQKEFHIKTLQLQNQMHMCVIKLDQEQQCITLLTHPPHTPWPCRGAVLSQKSRTCWPQKDSLQTLECPAPQTPAGSDSSGSSSAGWSSSWQTSAVSHGALPGTQPCKSTLKSGSQNWLIFLRLEHTTQNLGCVQTWHVWFD